MAVIITHWVNLYFTHVQTTIDGDVACLPNEYPRINDCEAPDVSVIYKERLTKKRKNKKKKKEDGDDDDDDDDDDDGNGNLACFKSALTFALPKFKKSGFYDPCESLICSGNLHELAFSLLMLSLINAVFRLYWLAGRRARSLVWYFHGDSLSYVYILEFTGDISTSTSL